MGNIFYEGYKHNSCDVELWCRLKAKDLLVFAPHSRIIHHHYFCTSKGETADKKDEWYEKIEKWSLEDRLLLPRRLLKLGLKKDAYLYASWLMDLSRPPQVPESINLRHLFEKHDFFYQDKDILNLGVGDGKSGLAMQLPHFHFGSIVNADIEERYLEMAKKAYWNAKTVDFVEGDVTDFEFGPYDAIFAFDFIEHLEKKKALKTLKRMVKSGKRAFVFCPLEKELGNQSEEIPSMRHQSIWTEQEFKELGFKTEVLPNFHGTFSACWAIL
jgi:hypothetical protein